MPLFGLFGNSKSNNTQITQYPTSADKKANNAAIPSYQSKLFALYDRNTKDVEDLIQAYIQATAYGFDQQHHIQTRARLIDIYEQIMLDAHLSGIVESRKCKVLGEPFELLDKNGLPQKEVELLQRQWFEDAIEIILDADYYGYSLGVLGPIKNGEIDNVESFPRRHYLPDQHAIIPYSDQPQHQVAVDKFLNPDYHFRIYKRGNYGLLLKAGKHAIQKRFTLGAWTEHADIHGMPMIILHSDSLDQDFLNEVYESARRRALLVNQDDKVQYFTQTNDPHNIYKELEEVSNKNMTILILGQTGTTEQGGSFAQSRVMKSEFEERIEKDKRRVEYYVNSELLPKLIRLGYPFKQDWKFRYRTDVNRIYKDLLSTVEIVNTAYHLDPRWVEQKLDMPKGTLTERIEVEPTESESATQLDRRNERRRIQDGEE